REVTLAFQPEAAQAHTDALLVAVGSYALDRLLEHLRQQPAAVVGALPPRAAPVAGLPAYPSAVNGRILPGPWREEWLPVALALFRVKVMTDEAQEHLVPVVVDWEGRPRPDLVEVCRAAGLQPPPTDQSRTLSGPAEWLARALTAAEAPARAAAEQLARQAEQQAESRLRADLERLDAYYRELREDLTVDLRSAASRAVARVHEQAERIRRILEHTLPADGPLRKPEAQDRLLELRKRRRWPRREEAPFTPEDVDAAIAFLNQMVSPFTREQALNALGRDVERRLLRLEKRLEVAQQRREQAGPAPTREYDEARNRLEKEFERRAAETRERFQARALVTPVLLECLWYPRQVAEVAYVGRGEARLTAVWDAVRGVAEPSPCPRCGTALAEVWLCEAGHLTCPACRHTCRACGRTRCRPCGMAICAICQQPACDSCGGACPRCGGWTCAPDRRSCAVCQASQCARCAVSCSACDHALCSQHASTCGMCGRPACPEHLVVCRFCASQTCPEHGQQCGICGEGVCDAHRRPCASCGQRYCQACVSERDRCQTCLSLQPVGPATTEAILQRLAYAAPTFPAARIRQWWFARNRHYWIVLGRRWWRHHLFVLDAERREVRWRRSGWSLRAPRRPGDTGQGEAL
ncbi:MAG: hypothetical protein HY320_04220, partial [Armatimonadetes bacterium]|nr:hypothetical protein [Armatimonadota bacterium]